MSRAVSQIERELVLVREYRTRLIADVVLGKLDVRESAAQLPDAPDREEDSGDSSLAADLDDGTGEADLDEPLEEDAA